MAWTRPPVGGKLECQQGEPAARPWRPRLPHSSAGTTVYSVPAGRGWGTPSDQERPSLCEGVKWKELVTRACRGTDSRRTRARWSKTTVGLKPSHPAEWTTQLTRPVAGVWPTRRGPGWTRLEAWWAVCPSLDGGPHCPQPSPQEAWHVVSAAGSSGPPGRPTSILPPPQPAPSFLESAGSPSSGQ